MGLSHRTIAGKPRVLIILNRFVIGGQAVDTIPLAYFLQQDFEILILYGEKEVDEIEPAYLLKVYQGLQLKKIRHLRRSINPLTDVIAFIRLLSILAKFKPHIVHTHGAKSGFLGRLSAMFCGVPVIIHTFHGHFFHSYFSPNISRIISFAEKTIGKNTTAAIALSEAQKIELAEEFKILPASKIVVIRLGFAYDNSSDSTASRMTFRDKYHLKDEDVAIGIVGRVVPVKNHSFFVQVINSILKNEQTNAAFFIIGDGELRKKVEDELSRRNIAFNNSEISASNRVVFTSWITDMYQVMNGLDIVALTSLNEGTPLSIIESEFFKKPVISTNVGGVKDTMKDGETGFLVDKHDVPGFTKNLMRLINDKNLRFKMGEAGSKFAQEKFGKQTEVSKTKEFYFSLLKQKGFHVLPLF